MNNKKILFVCDLDNTLIHSKKHYKTGDVLVECIDGKEQSYMSQKAYDLFLKLNQLVDFVPVTTRSIQQFKRINLPFKTAFTTNATILLKDSEIDRNFIEYSKNRVASYKQELERLCNLYKDDKRFRIVRYVDDMFLFLACADGFNAETCVPDIRKQTGLYTENTGYKIYIFPPTANKGESVEYFKKINYDFIFGAGDSPIDLAMLKKCDKAFVPDVKLAERLENAVVLKENFTENMLEYVLDFLKN